MSRISLLTHSGEAAPLRTAGEKEPGRAILRDLQLDKTFLLLCPEAAPREALLNVLCTPCTDPEDIRHRYRTGEIFREHPALHDSLLSIFRRLNQTKTAWDQDRSRLFTHRRANPSDLQLQLSGGRDVLGLTCMYLRSAMAQIREVSTLLENHPDCLPVLAVFKENCDRVWRGHQPFIEFADRCHKLISQAYRYDIEYTLDEELRTGGFLLRDFAHIRTQASREKQKPNGLWQMLTRKTEEVKKPETAAPEIGQSLGQIKPETQLEITVGGINECDRYLTAMLRGLLDRFSLLEEELYFYLGVLQYRHALEEKGILPCFPEITPSETGTIEITDLYDLLLLAGSPKDRVVPNDVHLSCIREENKTAVLPGMLIHGENNSGKTVFLRSAGSAILLSQCGLPIPASGGTVSIRRRLYTQFATAEGELVSGSAAGRFEEEAAALARMLDEMEPDSLLLLNETFQTTAYGEGASGIYPILHYIADCGGAFVFVTHLTALLSAMRGRAVIAKTSDDPRTRYKLFLEEV